MDDNNSKEWWQSRTNLTSLMIALCVLGPMWGSKVFGSQLSQGQIEALVTVILSCGLPLIVYFRNTATKLIAWVKEKN